MSQGTTRIVEDQGTAMYALYDGIRAYRITDPKHLEVAKNRRDAGMDVYDYIVTAGERVGDIELVPIKKTHRYFLCRGGLTGLKIHMGCSGVSVLSCGRWVKTIVTRFEIHEPRKVNDRDLCEKCFPGRTIGSALIKLGVMNRRWEDAKKQAEQA